MKNENNAQGLFDSKVALGNLILEDRQLRLRTTWMCWKTSKKGHQGKKGHPGQLETPSRQRTWLQRTTSWRVFGQTPGAVGPRDSFLFPRIKAALERAQISSLQEIPLAMTMTLQEVSGDPFQNPYRCLEAHAHPWSLKILQNHENLSNKLI